MKKERILVIENKKSVYRFYYLYLFLRYLLYNIGLKEKEMAFLIYNSHGYTVPQLLLNKYSLKNGNTVDDFSIINDKEFYESFIEDVNYFKWHIEFQNKSGSFFFTQIEAIDQDEAKNILESEKNNIIVTLVCDFWDKRKKRKKY